MTFTRRMTLQWVATATTMALASRSPVAQATGVGTGIGTAPSFAVVDWPAAVPALPATKGYGRDPDLTEPKVPWPLTLTRAQRATVDVFGDLILPADAVSPGAGALGVGAFIDEWISAPYPVQQADRGRIVAGLTWLDAQSNALHGQPFGALAAPRQAVLLDALTVASPVERMVAPVAFMDRLRQLFVLGFYSLPEGKADMGYIGDEPVEGPYPGPDRKALAHLAGLLDTLKLAPSRG